MSILMVVDDHERTRALLRTLLANEGHTVLLAEDGDEALQQLREQEVDLVLLDVVMPKSNGLMVLSVLRKNGFTTPVVVVSGVDDVSLRVQALDLGAVDFIVKPFHNAELVARVRRHLVDQPHERDNQRFLEVGGLRLDMDRRLARMRGKDVYLSEREFGLLAHLARRHGDVCTRSELLHDVWGFDFDPGSNLVEVCMRRIRKKVPDVPVETIRSVGYCFTDG
ncbi:response regulator transcription factor [Tessaracoccus sp. MC1865]|uniref:response regulator transcription factor n=1 Tax=unclassified Tessaracoccus TaxID=2635419 RepID=UPI00160354E8|nr:MULTISPECIES: response regulator transcription factor [unclassified Tessaracoccus]MBB1482774.1 response regulator transcription factor [Tessaracoccus sp. MC1865]MBB1509974.1 response regulator transcription factor [Tessaracoccus sp. MC1756]QTO37780.1 response regulator transcription factor [Tessaracoccus sp. MC1865]